MRPEDLLARTGGDEFAVLFAERVDLTTVRAEAGSLIETLRAPFALDHITVQVDASVGIALYPDHCLDPQHLLARAEAAMSHAKATVSRIAVYDAAEDTDNNDDTDLVEDLRAALSAYELTCHYQPKIGANDGRCTASRRSCGGSIPHADCCFPISFCPPPNRPASCARWPPGCSTSRWRRFAPGVIKG